VRASQPNATFEAARQRSLQQQTRPPLPAHTATRVRAFQTLCSDAKSCES
jgi:hypothetical protein